MPRSIAPAALALALLVGGTAACGDDGGSGTASTTTEAPSASEGPSSASETVSANDASAEEIAAALDAAGVANADRWADEVVEYRPYDDADQGFPRLREELAKYDPPEGTIDQIVAVLS